MCIKKETTHRPKYVYGVISVRFVYFEITLVIRILIGELSEY